MPFLSEAEIEATLLNQLETLGYTRLADSPAGPGAADLKQP